MRVLAPQGVHHHYPGRDLIRRDPGAVFFAWSSLLGSYMAPIGTLIEVEASNSFWEPILSKFVYLYTVLLGTYAYALIYECSAELY